MGLIFFNKLLINVEKGFILLYGIRFKNTVYLKFLKWNVINYLKPIINLKYRFNKHCFVFFKIAYHTF